MIPTEPPFEHMLGIHEPPFVVEIEGTKFAVPEAVALLLKAVSEERDSLLAVARAAKIVEKMAEYDLEHDRPGYYIHSDDFHWLVVALAAVEDLLKEKKDG